MITSVLLVDDDQTALRSLESSLTRRLPDYKFYQAANSEKALQIANDLRPEVCIVDLSLNNQEGPESGLNLISKLLEADKTLRILVLTGHDSESYGIRSLEAGASSFIGKPANADHLAPLIKDAASYSRLLKANQRSMLEDSSVVRFGELSTRSSSMVAVIDKIAQSAQSRQPVLLLGETGVGKGVVATAIHRNLFAKGAPFIRYQPGFSGGDLIASELFGHQKGAFTGAVENRKGLLEEADGGTLFIDEVDELPTAVQVMLLQTLQEKTFRKLGSSTEKRSNFRLLAASNFPISQSLDSGKIRQDFFHRIAHLVIEIPPLRKRSEDILPLADEYLTKISYQEKIPVQGLSRAAREKFLEYSWPGNIRELQAVTEASLYRAHYLDHRFIEAEDVEFQTFEATNSSTKNERMSHSSFRDQVEQFELRLVTEALNQSDQNQSRAAELLKLDRSTLRRILARR